MRRLAIVALVLLAAGAGFVVGSKGGSWLDRLGHDPAVARPGALESAWRAHDAGDREALTRALEALDRTTMPTAEFVAEAEILHALADDDGAALEALAERHAGSPAGAIALFALAERAATPDERSAFLGVLRARYPDSWVPGPGDTR